MNQGYQGISGYRSAAGSNVDSRSRFITRTSIAMMFWYVLQLFMRSRD